MKTKETRAFKGIWIPAEVWLHEGLTMQEKLFLVEIDSLDNDEGCYAKNSYFMGFFGLSKRRVAEVLNSLTQKGFIETSVTYKDGTKEVDKRVIRICTPPYPTFQGLHDPIAENRTTPMRETAIPCSGKLHDPIAENRTDNNTDNNTVDNIISLADLRRRYSDVQLQIVDRFFGILKHTRVSARIADSVIIKIFQEWEKHEAVKVIFALQKYINNPNLHDKKENYVLGIIRNTKMSEINGSVTTGSKSDGFADTQRYENNIWG
jgi:hypothetical protein